MTGESARPTDVRCVLAVHDIHQSARWYVQMLGMAVEFTAPGWVFLSRGPFRLMLGECKDAIAPAQLGDHNWYAYVTMDDVEAYYAEVRDRGVALTQSLADKPWGMREFGVRTLDGHRIMFGQPLPD